MPSDIVSKRILQTAPWGLHYLALIAGVEREKNNEHKTKLIGTD